MSFRASIVNPKEDWKSALNLGGGLPMGIEGWHCAVTDIAYSPFLCHPLNFVIFC